MKTVRYQLYCPRCESLLHDPGPEHARLVQALEHAAVELQRLRHTSPALREVRAVLAEITLREQGVDRG